MNEYAVPVEDAMARLDVIPDYDCGNGPEPCVHTFMESAIGLLGAHWSLPTVRKSFETHGVMEAGPEATESGHGLVVIETDADRQQTIFFATAPAETKP